MSARSTGCQLPVVTSEPDAGPAPWRVGYHLDPLGFTPHELYGFNHRFGDIQHRIRTLYFAELPETCLREVLTDFRPILAARERHIERGPDQPDRTVGFFSYCAKFRRKPVTCVATRRH